MSREFKDALNTYYSLKNQYENNFNKDKNKIKNTPGLSWREKRSEFQKLKKKCINCKRPVGTKFQTITEENVDERHLTAICGDRANPCPLNIDLNIGYTVDILDVIQKDEKNIAEDKKTIIKEKNNLLFGYTTAKMAVASFDILKEMISNTMQNYEYTLKMYMDITNNKEKTNATKKLQAELFLNIANYKKLIDDYENSQDIQYIVDALELYKTEILPQSKKIMNAKYAYSEVEFNEDDNTYYLIQKPVTIEQFEWDLSENPPGIVSMKMGIDKFQMKGKPMTSANVAAIPMISAKKPKLVLKQPVTPSIEKEKEEKEEKEEVNSVSSEEEEDEEEEDRVPLPKITIQPELLPDGSIAATEADRLKWKIDLVNGLLQTKNPTNGKVYNVVAGI